ncbi:redoxin family protein [Spongiimicrobium salis]|uniref:redoxin family protein n=1 Tax=Spongiimicrobium salis TaxID=1667022 RepID=UPI00374DDE6F
MKSLRIAPTYVFYLLLAFSLSQCKSEPKKAEDGKQAEIAAVFDFVSHPVEVPEQTVKPLKIGDKAPDFRLPGTDEKYHALADYDDASVLVVIFTCNHCPTAQAYEERIKRIVDDYADKSVQIIAISPNSPLGLLYEELGYSDLGDTYEDMILRDKAHNFNFPYLYDGDNQKVSLAYGPAATPHTFVFDQNRILQYIGRIDNSEKPGTANGEDLRNAIDAILDGASVEQPVTKTFGCSTKWGWKTKTRKKIDTEWTQKEVSLEDLSIADVKGVMKNENSGKLRLVNIWATWCGPCRIEYPEFIVIQRMFGARDFEFVSISADKIEKKSRALDFLKEKYSAVTNYIVTSKDNYELIEAIDPNWNGALPYTALIEPGGNIVWEHQGEVDFLALKQTIVDHKMIGRVY